LKLTLYVSFIMLQAGYAVAGRLRGSVRRASGLVLSALSESEPNPMVTGSDFRVCRQYVPVNFQKSSNRFFEGRQQPRSSLASLRARRILP
jgi:hypothetical protein